MIRRKLKKKILEGALLLIFIKMGIEYCGDCENCVGYRGETNTEHARIIDCGIQMGFLNINSELERQRMYFQPKPTQEAQNA